MTFGEHCASERGKGGRACGGNLIVDVDDVAVMRMRRRREEEGGGGRRRMRRVCGGGG